MENPKRIGKYEIEEFLGGGMSQVYRARDTVIGRTVAIKILTQSGVADAETKARFLREAQMAGSLAHENIMSVYDFGEDEGQPFMVMEFLRGEDLRSAMKNGRTGNIEARLQIAIQVARALDYIHRQKIIHRDIKPENIHINTNGSVKLMDFGVAKTDELSLTRPGYTMGTPYYMAPEQVLGKDVTPLADVYSFGMLLYELLTGSRAVQAETIEQLFYKILNEPVDTGPLRDSGAPESICSLVEKCIAKNPADRPQDMGAVQIAIEKALEPAKPSGQPEEAAPSRPKWLIPAAVVVVLFLAAAVGLFFSMRGGNAPAVKKAEPSPLLSTSTGEMVLIRSATAPAFYMDRTEVTNEAYARFCAERQKPLPSGFPQNRPGHPVVNITIVDAKEFAKWAQKRLPIKLEWDIASGAKDGHAYPWGNSRNASYANVLDNTALSEHALMPADSFKQGASPYGVLQMAGNVWEFVDELVPKPSSGAMEAYSKIMTPPPAADEPWYTITGGSYEVALIKDAAFEWSAVPARYRATNIGFRCVKDIP